MLRKLLFVSFVLTIGAVFWFYNDTNTIIHNEPTPTPEVLGVPEKDFPRIISLNGASYNVFWYIPDVDKIILVPNYEAKLTSDEVINEYGCEFLINGGFYDEYREPLGLVIADSKQIGAYRQSSLFNGLFSINYFLTPRITREVPEDTLKIAVQSGPILFDNGKQASISIENDKNARRSVAAVTGENELVFIHFTGTNNSYYGPTLTELPALIDKLNRDSHLNIADALNLDGGSASVYIKRDIRIKEINFPGAYFCEQ